MRRVAALWSLSLVSSSSFLLSSAPRATMSMMRATAARHGGSVIVIGSANQDLTSYTRRIPSMGETVLGESFTLTCGGKGANQANAAAGVSGGRNSVSMVCRVGPDVMGQALLDNFSRRGVEVDAMESSRSTTSTGVASILVDMETGDNQIVVTPGANLDLEPSDVRRALESLVPTSATDPHVVLVSLEIRPETAWHALVVAKSMGATTVLNPAPTPDALDMFPWTSIDVLIPNQSELEALYRMVVGDADTKVDEVAMARTLLQQGIQRAVIVTLGARGAVLVEPTVDTATYVSAPDQSMDGQPVVDTVGAGDAFCGALCAHVSSGTALVRAATLACGYAGASVRRTGTDYPTWHELPETLRLAATESMPNESPRSQLTFVTGNTNKLLEVQKILAHDAAFPFDIVNQAVDLPELQGDVYDIAKEKCRLAVATVQGPCFTEDTSLCFNALNGMPGPYIKWFLKSCGHHGLNQMLAGFDDQTAYAQTVIAYSDGPTKDGDSEIHVFEGRTNGTIVPPRGSLDFGWDPIFEPMEGNGQTYAEMSKDAKNTISHRGRAFAKLRDYLIRANPA